VAEQLANHFVVLGKNVQRRHRSLEKQHASH